MTLRALHRTNRASNGRWVGSGFTSLLELSTVGVTVALVWRAILTERSRITT